MLTTKINEILNIKYPILMGGMQWLSKAEFVASVSNAGGLAFITASTFRTPQELQSEIRKAKELTEKPFGVNISMLPDVSSGEQTQQFLDVTIAEKIKVIETSGRSPEELIPKAKDNGIKVIHKVPAGRYALSAEKAGADAVILVGYEAGGHPGLDQVGTFVNLQSAIKMVKIPVIAAGGICDGAGLAAVLMLGAQGAMMGTRFLATKESPVHQNLKDWMIQAKVTDTIITQRTIRNAFRCIRNEHAYQVLGMEESGATLKELLPVISGALGRRAWEEGHLNDASVAMGQDVGLIDDLPSVQELLDRIMKDAEERIKMAGEYIHELKTEG